MILGIQMKRVSYVHLSNSKLSLQKVDVCRYAMSDFHAAMLVRNPATELTYLISLSSVWSLVQDYIQIARILVLKRVEKSAVVAI
jgi:hypothetical protein